jgi:glycosyltransferase involved in cell wall biosynthesis
MTRLLFVIRSLNVGGGERQLCELVRGLSGPDFVVTVVAFYDGGELKEELETIPEIRTISLGKRSRWDVVRFLWRLWQTLDAEKPHIVHGYMSAANEISLVMGKLVRAKVVWGVRAAYVNYSLYDYLSSAFFRLGCWLSRYTDLILINSQSGKDYHVACGYPPDKMIVIRNGIDAQRFTPDATARTRTRSEWKIGSTEVVVGLVSRLDPIKGHRIFLQAVSIVVKSRPDIRFVCVGGGSVIYERELRELSDELDVSSHVLWIGHRSDISAVYNSLDIMVSASHGEGFSNAVAEAMGCGVPCVVTDVGDSSSIVDKWGEVVPPNDPTALARGIIKLLERLTKESSLKLQVRNRIVAKFSVAQCIQSTKTALLALL